MDGGRIRKTRTIKRRGRWRKTGKLTKRRRSRRKTAKVRGGGIQQEVEGIKRKIAGR